MFRYNDSLASIFKRHRTLLTLIGPGAGISLLFLSCGRDAADTTETETVSENLGFSRGELRSSPAARAGSFKAADLLEDAGWCEIPAKALPRGMSHSDLVRQMGA